MPIIRRLSRYLFNFLSDVSLALWVATVVLWVRSYWYSDWVSATTDVSFEGDQSRFEAWTASGKFMFSLKRR